MTLDKKCLLKLGIGVAVPKAAAGSLAGKYGPAIAARGVGAVAGPVAGAYTGMVGTTAAAAMSSPPGVAFTILGAASFLVKQCECKAGK